MATLRRAQNGDFVTVDGVATYATAAALRAASVASTTAGALAFVETFADYFAFAPTSTEDDDGVVVLRPASIAAPDPGRWIRQLTAARRWRIQGDWWIATDGSDENDGATVDTPLRTLDELGRRWGLTYGAELLSNPNVTLGAGDHAGALIGRVTMAPAAAATITITGTPTQQAAGTIASYTPAVRNNAATSEADLITSGAIADWTPHVGQRVRLTDGAAAGAYAWVIAANPAGAGLNVARVTPFQFFATPVAPGVGDAFVVETLSSIEGLQLETNRAINLDSLHVNSPSDAIGLRGPSGVPQQVQGCRFTCVGVDPGGSRLLWITSLAVAGNGGSVWLGPGLYLGTSLGFVGALQLSAGAYFNGTGTGAGHDVLIQAGALNITSSQMLGNPIGIFDSPFAGVPKVNVLGGAGVVHKHELYGRGNAGIGLQLEGASTWGYVAGPPYLAASGGYARVNGVTIARAAVPYAPPALDPGAAGTGFRSFYAATL